MTIVKTVHCDLCGEAVAKGKAVTVLVGSRDLRPEDYELADIGPECTGRPLAELAPFLAKARAAVYGEEAAGG